MLRTPALLAKHGPRRYNRDVKDVSLVMLTNLPTTASMTDIRALTYKQPWQPSPETPITLRDSSSSSLAASLSTITFVRTKLLNKSDKVLVRFHDPLKAKEFAEAANERMIGGHMIKAQLTQKRPAMASEAVSILSACQMQSPGRVVMLKGLPLSLSDRHLTRILGTQYDLATDKVQWEDSNGTRHTFHATVKVTDYLPYHNMATFLVRFSTVTGAMALVRRWHRTVWRSSDEEVLRGRAEGFTEEEGDRVASPYESRVSDEYGHGDEEPLDIDSRDSLQAEDSFFGLKDKLQATKAQADGPDTRQRCIIDAYIMY